VEEVAQDDFVEWAKAIFEKAKNQTDPVQNSQLNRSTEVKMEKRVFDLGEV
jgi:hypothetical protein